MMSDFILRPPKKTMPGPVRYYIGDLCYVLDDATWQTLCTQLFSSNRADNKYTFPDGRVFWCVALEGDGRFPLRDGITNEAVAELSVDSGTIGMAKLEGLAKYDSSSRHYHAIDVHGSPGLSVDYDLCRVSVNNADYIIDFGYEDDE